MAGWKAPSSMGAWSGGGNNDTATTYETFMTALGECNENECNVYFNIHTNYSFVENPGYGLARGQLVPKDCPESKPDGAKCFGGNITTVHTNEVDGLANQLPATAGEVADVLITYTGDLDDLDQTGGMPVTEPTDDSDDSADSAGIAHSGFNAVATLSATFAAWFL